jgi:hypothetical protein
LIRPARRAFSASDSDAFPIGWTATDAKDDALTRNHAVGFPYYDKMNKINWMRDEVGNAGFDSLFGDDSGSRFSILRIL